MDDRRSCEALENNTLLFENNRISLAGKNSNPPLILAPIIIISGMSNLIALCSNQEMIWKVGVCNRSQKQENKVFLTPIIVLK